MTSIFDHPWLGGLFSDPDLQALWSAEVQIMHYRKFEIALAHALEAHGLVAAGLGQKAAIRIEQAPLDIPQLARATAIDGLPIPNFVKQMHAAAPDCAEAIHAGATSQDVLDTALSITLAATTNLLTDRISKLLNQLDRLVEDYGCNRLVARTRMQAALPVTAAERIATWRSPLQSALANLNDTSLQIARLQLGGAVGTRDAFEGKGDAIAEEVAKALTLTENGVWHSDRSQIAGFASLLSQITGALGKMGQDIALMAQQGVDAIALSGGGGSSAMPHKSNPVLAELLITLARFNATQLSAMHHSLVHEQERSGAAWMLEWMVLPQMAMATGSATLAAKDLCNKIRQIGDDG